MSLSTRQKLFFGLTFTVLAATVVGLIVVTARRRQARAETLRALGDSRTVQSLRVFSRHGPVDRWNRTLFVYTRGGGTCLWEPFDPPPSYRGTTYVRWEDGWGRPIRVRAPGTVHKKGWDAWSIGEDGIDEQGSGDDLLAGEDVAPVTTDGGF